VTYLKSIVPFNQSLGSYQSETPGNLIDLVRLGIVRCQHNLNDAHRERRKLGRLFYLSNQFFGCFILSSFETEKQQAERGGTCFSRLRTRQIV
jgi:hypothetical protein